MKKNNISYTLPKSTIPIIIIDLRALTLAGNNGTNSVLDPLAVLRLDNQLYIVGSRGASQLGGTF